MYFSTVLLLAASALTLAAPTTRDVGPDPNSVFIKTFTFAGSGCPAGSVANSTDPTKTVLTLLFDRYVAQIGPGTLPTDHRKNCQINLDVHFPNGWQFSIFSVDYRGFEQLDRGVTGTQMATYYFSGQRDQISASTTFPGPKTPQNYLISSDFLVDSLVWSPCGANLPLNINSQIFLTSTNTNANGLLTTDSTDFKFHQIFHIRWRQCH
ncbi:hypothetical protein B0J14DRAFT_708013 [Halenospora varia]|nr:hypothetical protein B0J14DRAFT_708013 [Halenospora varia]